MVFDTTGLSTISLIVTTVVLLSLRRLALSHWSVTTKGRLERVRPGSPRGGRTENQAATKKTRSNLYLPSTAAFHHPLHSPLSGSYCSADSVILEITYISVTHPRRLIQDERSRLLRVSCGRRQIVPGWAIYHRGGSYLNISALSTIVFKYNMQL